MIHSYRGEFGPEIVTFIPYIYSLHLQGHFQTVSNKVSTYAGMKPFYFFLNSNQLIERLNENRMYLPKVERDWPNADEHSSSRTASMSFPDYQSFAKSSVNQLYCDIFIQNKFALEWGIRPYNFLPLDTLNEMLELLVPDYTIAYSRPGIANLQAVEFAPDHNVFLPYDDWKLFDLFPEIKVIEKEDFSEISYNMRKLLYLSSAKYLIGVQGGGSHLFAYFDRPTFLLHIKGSEKQHAYGKGFYQYIADRQHPLFVSDEPKYLFLFIYYIIFCEIDDEIGKTTLRGTLQRETARFLSA